MAGEDHVDIASSSVAFVEMYRYLMGRDPQYTEVQCGDEQVTIEGLAETLGDNVPVTDGRIEVYEMGHEPRERGEDDPDEEADDPARHGAEEAVTEDSLHTRGADEEPGDETPHREHEEEQHQPDQAGAGAEYQQQDSNQHVAHDSPCFPPGALSAWPSTLGSIHLLFTHSDAKRLRCWRDGEGAPPDPVPSAPEDWGRDHRDSLGFNGSLVSVLL